jgi:hypothetical protein
MDATSPVKAYMHFCKTHDRRKQTYYLVGWYDTLQQLMTRHEVVIFLWQTSHVGSPVNEMADVAAAAAAEVGERLEVPLLAARCGALWSVEASKGSHAWVAPRARECVRARLVLSAVKETQQAEWDDAEYGRLCDSYGVTAEAARGARLQLGDERVFAGRSTRDAAVVLGCPLGCGCEGDRGRGSHSGM